MTLCAGVLTWCAQMVLIAGLSARPIGARVGLLVATLLLPLPVLVTASPLARCLLACFMGMSFARAADLIRGPPIVRFRQRLAHLCAYFDTREVKQRASRFDTAMLQNLIAATTILALAIAAAKAAPTIGPWLPVRWLAGGIGLLAVAEMASACHDLFTAPWGLSVPPLFRSPHRSTTVTEFWAKRWNLAASEVLRKYCFTPLARHGPAFALFATFALSAVGHALLVDLALGSRGLAVACASFFLAQPLLIASERRMRVLQWRPAAGRAWTLSVLAITSPLVVEPILRIVEKAWGAPGNVLLPTAAALGFVGGLNLLTLLDALASRGPKRG